MPSLIYLSEGLFDGGDDFVAMPPAETLIFPKTFPTLTITFEAPVAELDLSATPGSVTLNIEAPPGVIEFEQPVPDFDAGIVTRPFEFIMPVPSLTITPVVPPYVPDVGGGSAGGGIGGGGRRIKENIDDWFLPEDEYEFEVPASTLQFPKTFPALTIIDGWDDIEEEDEEIVVLALHRFGMLTPA